MTGKDDFWEFFNISGTGRGRKARAGKGRTSEMQWLEGRAGTGGARLRPPERSPLGPVPNWLQGAKGQAGRTFNWDVVDEWTKVEAMTPKGTKLTGEGGNNAFKFTSTGKKDIAYAMLYAYVRALLWLKGSELEFGWRRAASRGFM